MQDPGKINIWKRLLRILLLWNKMTTTRNSYKVVILRQLWFVSFSCFYLEIHLPLCDRNVFLIILAHQFLLHQPLLLHLLQVRLLLTGCKTRCNIFFKFKSMLSTIVTNLLALGIGDLVWSWERAFLLEASLLSHSFTMSRHACVITIIIFFNHNHICSTCLDKPT